MAMLERYSEHGAVVLRDDESAMIRGFKVGQIAVLIKDPSHHRHFTSECLPHHSRARALEAASGTTVKDPCQQCRILLFYILQQLVGELRVSARKQGVTGRGQCIEVFGATGGQTEPAVGKQPISLERGQVLAHTAEGDPDAAGDPLGVRFSVSLDDIKDFPARGRHTRECGVVNTGKSPGATMRCHVEQIPSTVVGAARGDHTIIRDYKTFLNKNRNYLLYMGSRSNVGVDQGRP